MAPPVPSCLLPGSPHQRVEKNVPGQRGRRAVCKGPGPRSALGTHIVCVRSPDESENHQGLNREGLIRASCTPRAPHPACVRWARR